MSPEERRRRGTRLCAKLASDVNELVPAGIGAWDPAWDIVGDADAEFMIALLKWEGTGSEADKESVRTAYATVLDAWRSAAGQFEQQSQRTP